MTARRVEKKEKNFDELVGELAALIIKENKNYVGKDVAEEAVKRINEARPLGELYE